MLEKDWAKFLQQANTEYKKIGYIKCPAFDNESIFFTMAGFRHLLRKNGVLRPKEEQKRRLDLISQASSLLSAATKCTTHFKNKNNISIVQFWSFTFKIALGTITIIIRQVNSNPKHFFSVFDEPIP